MKLKAVFAVAVAMSFISAPAVAKTSESSDSRVEYKKELLRQKMRARAAETGLTRSSSQETLTKEQQTKIDRHIQVVEKISKKAARR